MKGTKTIQTIFILFSFVLLQGCSVPFANGITAKDVIQTINGARNLSKITKEGAKEEVITEAKSIFRSIQAGGQTQR
jgi:hypothetical protein